MSVWMSLIEFSLTTTMRGIRLATLALHLHEPVPAADRPPLVAVRRGIHLELTVPGDRVMERDDRRDHRLELDDPVAEALVVVDEVELAERGFRWWLARALNASGSGNTPVKNWATSRKS